MEKPISRQRRLGMRMLVRLGKRWLGRNLSRTEMSRVDTKYNMIRYIKIVFPGI